MKGTCEVLRWRETNCPDARLIYLSTLCAAGKCIGPIAEAPLEMPKGFVNGYEASKWRAEQIVQATGGPIVIVRLATVVGAQSDGSLCRVGAFGDPEWSKERIALLQVEVDRIARRCGLPVHWETAEDPFFLPTAKGKALMQRLMETKKELVWDGPEPLAIARINRHGTFFGERFAIRRSDMTPVHTACVAFGLDRRAAMQKSDDL